MGSRQNNSGKILFAAAAAKWLRQRLQRQPDWFLLCDTHTRQHCLPLFEATFGAVPDRHLLVMPAGEAHKQLSTAEALWRQLQQANAKRDSLLLNLGGGVVCDMGGFVAATWKRGIPFIHLPTSLMAQSDAAIGGKCALNFGGIKNQIGLFRQPEAVCIAPAFLQTLPPEELHAGFAEMLKHGIIADADHFRTLQQTDSRTPPSTALIRRSIAIKKSFVRQDAEDRNLRKALNFGHSIGHLLEALSEGALSHGVAVAHGMRAEAQIARNKGLLPAGDWEEIAQCIQQHYGASPAVRCSCETMERLLAADKKCDAGSLNFSLPTAIGQVVTNCSVNFGEVWEVLQPDSRP